MPSWGSTGFIQARKCCEQSLGRPFRVRRSAMSSIWPMSASNESIAASAFPERPSCLLHKRCRLASSKAFSDRPSALHSANLHHAMSMQARTLLSSTRSTWVRYERRAHLLNQWDGCWRGEGGRMGDLKQFSIKWGSKSGKETAEKG